MMLRIVLDYCWLGWRGRAGVETGRTHSSSWRVSWAIQLLLLPHPLPASSLGWCDPWWPHHTDLRINVLLGSHPRASAESRDGSMSTQFPHLMQRCGPVWNALGVSRPASEPWVPAQLGKPMPVCISTVWRHGCPWGSSAGGLL